MKSNLTLSLCSALLFIPALAVANPPASVRADNASAERYGAERYTTSDARSSARLFDARAAREFPGAIYDRIARKITLGTTFVLVGADRMIRWAPRSLQLIAFVKSPSHSDPDTFLYVLSYAVALSNDADSKAIYDTSCQVVIVSKGADYDEPTIDCEPLELGRSKQTS